MNIKELLLNGKAFLALLNDFAIEAKNVIIQDEDMLFSGTKNPKNPILKETVCIEAKNDDGIFNFFGTVHFNLLDKLAVFEMQGFEKVNAKA
ncbi:MAG: hypothetical protein REI64_10560 [Pedobacter sp.]|uniref:hypothetical protein n=1 Tax=Pedobacter sp. TaxID=1411316 RepID=UPI002806A64E|nr:hypothetical protein [Pedobacter sp.]MDQ8005231.1 hypothetical protein [Pedobacter sp.]